MSNPQTCSARDASTYLGNPCQTSWYLTVRFFFASSAVWIFVAGIYNCYFLYRLQEKYTSFCSPRAFRICFSSPTVYAVWEDCCCISCHSTVLWTETSDLFPSCSLIWSSQLFLKWLFTKWGIQLQCCRKYRPGVVCTVGSRPVQEYQCRFPHFCNKWFC